MAEPLKYIYNEAFFTEFTAVIKKVKPDFKKAPFLKDIYADNWEDKELKERMRHISIVLKKHLPDNFEESANLLVRMVDHLKGEEGEMSFEYMIFPDFIELYGMEDYDTSIKAFEAITEYASCEFAVRPFIIKYPKKMISQMKRWSKHPNAMVRRLSSEGCRPRLPWAMALPALKADPGPILPILERLKDDPSESVRRSVANNLNDISKDNPQLVIQLAKSWIGKNKARDWVLKHACRSLLKAGNPEVMQLFGFGNTEHIRISKLKVSTPKVKVGEALDFSFLLQNASNSNAKIRLEYGIYFQKANGSLSRKVFKISERDYPANSEHKIERQQSFRVITTRKLHPGLHQVSVIANGKEFGKMDFQLI